MMGLKFVLSLAVTLTAIAGGSNAAVHKYPGKAFFTTKDAWLFRGGREGLFQSSPDAVAHWTVVAKGLANGKSYIR